MFNPLHRAVSNGFLRRTRNATRKQLLGLSDQTLADIGVSRGALLRGNGAFPWYAAPWHAVTDGRSVRPVGMHASSDETSGRVTPPAPPAIASVSVLSLTLATAVLTPRTQTLRKVA